MRLLHIFLALMFMAFASLQVNDPAPVLWILIYGSMSVVCVMGIFKYYSRKFMTVLAVGFLAYCVILWPGISEWLQQENKNVLFDDGMKMNPPYIEQSRKFLGLVICLAVLTFYFLRSIIKRSA
jgi:lipopolysaccharide/colanic/teichoic acid biosynthesis glycosyltransferase